MKYIFYLLLLFSSLVVANVPNATYDSYGISKAEFSKGKNAEVYAQWQANGKFKWAAKSFWKDFYKGDPITWVDEDGNGIDDYAIIDAAQVYGYNSTDATIGFYQALEGTKNSNNTIVFSAQSDDWKIGAHMRLNNYDNMTIVLGDAAKLRKMTTAEGGLWNEELGNVKRYHSLARMVATYPNGTEGTTAANSDYKLIDRENAIFNVLGCTNLHFEMYRAELRGIFAEMPGIDPTTTSGKDYSFEHGHMIALYDIGPNVTIKGGHFRMLAGDALYVDEINLGGTLLIQDVDCKYSKRVNLAHIKGQGYITVKDSEFSFGGRGENGEYGTLTLQNITIEPNNSLSANQTAKGSYSNLRVTKAAGDGIGLQLSRPSAINGITDFDLTFTDIYLEGNSFLEDNTNSGAIALQSSDQFNTAADNTGGGNSIEMDNPVGGTAVFDRIIDVSTNAAFIWSKHYDGNYVSSFDNTYVYDPKVEVRNSLNNADGIVEWDMDNKGPNRTFSTFPVTNTTVFSNVAKPFIMFTIRTPMTSITNTVSGDVYMIRNSNEPIIQQKNGSIPNNATMTQTLVSHSAYVKPTVNLIATNDEAIESTSENGVFTFEMLGGDTSKTRMVKYSFTTSGQYTDEFDDFGILKGGVIFEPGETTATVNVVPRNNGFTESGIRSITMQIDDLNDIYTTGTNDQATVYLMNDPNSQRGPQGSSSSLYFEEDFEQPINTYINFPHNGKWLPHNADGIMVGNAVEGNQAMRFDMDEDTFGPKLGRREYSINATGTTPVYPFERDSTYGIRMFMRVNYPPDFWHSVAQAHSVPNGAVWRDPNDNNIEYSASSNLWNIWAKDWGELSFGMATDPAFYNNTDSGAFSGLVETETAIVNGVWNEVLLIFKASETTGRFDAWVNGEQVVDFSGRLGYFLDGRGLPKFPYTYFKAGLYTDNTPTTKGSVDYDDIVIRRGDNLQYSDLASPKVIEVKAKYEQGLKSSMMGF